MKIETDSQKFDCKIVRDISKERYDMSLMTI